MNREIKFRAFNTHDNEWYGDDLAKSLLYRDRIGDPYDRDKWKIVEYTGLKDKNGKEIYEGDILSGIIEVNDDERRTKHGNYATKKPFNAVTRVIFLEAEAKFVTYSNQKNSYYSGFWAGSGRTRQEKQNNQWRELTERVTVPISKLIEFEVIGNIYENPELLKP